MAKHRWRMWDYAFVALLVIALPAGVFHLAQGRYGQALMAAAALTVGAIIIKQGRLGQLEREHAIPARPGLWGSAWRWLNQQEAEETRRESLADWLPLGVVSGFAATGLASMALIAAYATAGAMGTRDPAAPLFSQWMGALVENSITVAARANLPVAMVTHFFAGILWATAYAGVFEPRLQGPSWRRGLIFSLIPWIASLVVFLPVSSAGFFGVHLGAGPLPVMGNLILHLIYGVTLGVVYASTRLLTETGQADSPVEPTIMGRVQRWMAAGMLPGLILGALIGLLGSGLFAPDSQPGMVAAVGAILGSALGVLLGSFLGLSARMPEP